MSCWSLTAVKSRACCKERLADSLTPDRRRELVESMLNHVLEVLRSSPDIDRVAVVTPDEEGLPEDVVRFADSGGGLNAALRHAARLASARGATRLLIVHADLPLLRQEDIFALIQASLASGVAIAPDRHGAGTNALCLALPPPLEFEFGPASFERHFDQAVTFGLSPAVVRRQGLGFDLDELEDLRAYANLIRSRPEVSPREGVNAR
jgi:2-phospho-L-lactate guanylyltransferase